MTVERQAALDELAHKRELIATLIRRRRPLEVQAAHRGMSAPPEILTEISFLTDQIRVYEVEISHLETLAAQGVLPLSEVEYRSLVAEAWDTPRGHPTVTGRARLELSRLRLGIVPEKAYEIERYIRIALAEEAFSNIEPSFFTNISLRIDDPRFPKDNRQSLTYLGRAIRLDQETARHLFFVNLQSSDRIAVYELSLRDMLLEINRVHQHSEDFLLFNHFLIALTADAESWLKKNLHFSDKE